MGLSVIALGLSGLFTILLVVARTSKHEYFATHDLFNTSLIVHVNLGILVWLLSMMMAYFNQHKPASPVSFYTAAIGTTLIILSPFIGTGDAYQNNYIPIYDNLYFKLGIMMFLASVFFGAAQSFIKRTEISSIMSLLAISYIAFFASYMGVEVKTSGHGLYEYTFWGGGHVMQFVYTQLMVVAWLELSKPVNEKWKKICLWAPVIFAAISTAYIYIAHKVESAEYTTLFTKQMIWGASLAAFGIGVMLIKARQMNLAVKLSMLLFTLGGVLGHAAWNKLSQGDSTTIIPAHYHASVMAVTIALMGLTYKMLGRNVWKTQLILYFVGQSMHVVSMAVMGFHGASRKTPGDMGEHTHKIWAQTMDTGGLIVLIGGIMFVVTVLKAILKNQQPSR